MCIVEVHATYKIMIYMGHVNFIRHVSYISNISYITHIAQVL